MSQIQEPPKTEVTPDDNHFFLPSQFEKTPDSPGHYRLKTGLIFTYKRNENLIAQIDFSDIAISEDIIEDPVLCEAIREQIYQDACLIADTHCTDKLQVGDIEYVNDVQNRIFTPTDISLIAQLHLQNNTEFNHAMTTEGITDEPGIE